MTRRRPPRAAWFIGLVALASLAAGCGQSAAARIRRLDRQEQELRASVQTLEAKQQALRDQIVRAQIEAESARCRASQESYRAVVAQLFAEHATRVAEHKGCKAKAAKQGGGLAALGCGLAAFATGGVALALCGGGLAVGYAVSESGCSKAPPEMSPEDIRVLAAVRTGLQREPTCGAPNSELRSPYGGASSSTAGEPRPGTLGLRAAPSLRESKREAREHRKAARKQKRQFKRQQKRQRRVLKKGAR